MQSADADIAIARLVSIYVHRPAMPCTFNFLTISSQIRGEIEMGRLMGLYTADYYRTLLYVGRVPARLRHSPTIFPSLRFLTYSRFIKPGYRYRHRTGLPRANTCSFFCQHFSMRSFDAQEISMRMIAKYLRTLLPMMPPISRHE